METPAERPGGGGQLRRLARRSGRRVERVIDQAAGSPPAVAMLSCCSTRSTGSSPHAARKRWRAARTSSTAARSRCRDRERADGGETTVIALDAALTGAGRFPALDLLASGMLKPEPLVGEAGAEGSPRRAPGDERRDADEE